MRLPQGRYQEKALERTEWEDSEVMEEGFFTFYVMEIQEVMIGVTFSERSAEITKRELADPKTREAHENADAKE